MKCVSDYLILALVLATYLILYLAKSGPSLIPNMESGTSLR